LRKHKLFLFLHGLKGSTIKEQENQKDSSLSEHWVKIENYQGKNLKISCPKCNCM